MAFARALLHRWHHLVEPVVHPWIASAFPAVSRPVNLLADRIFIADCDPAGLLAALASGALMHGPEFCLIEIIETAVNVGAIPRRTDDPRIYRHTRHRNAPSISSVVDACPSMV